MAQYYKIKEIYYTIQGEGFHAGRPAVFCRFSGCNLWSGREEDRSKAICKFCDTNFWGTDGINGGHYTKEDLSKILLKLWQERVMDGDQPFVVFTGGEPALQLDQDLVDYLHTESVFIAIETNGTKELPQGIDWVCVSPKADTEIIVQKGDELKLVFPQKENHPTQYEKLTFKYFFLQPLDDANQSDHIRACVSYCMEHPKWRLSLQTHKFIGID